MFVLFCYFILPIIFLYWIIRIFTGNRELKFLIVVAAVAALLFLYTLCFFSGLLFDFITEDDGFWHSMNLDFSYFDSHTAAAQTMGQMMMIPYWFAIQFLILSWNILWTHPGTGMIISFSIGLVTVSGWIYSFIMLNRMRDPEKMFPIKK